MIYEGFFFFSEQKELIPRGFIYGVTTIPKAAYRICNVLKWSKQEFTPGKWKAAELEAQLCLQQVGGGLSNSLNLYCLICRWDNSPDASMQGTFSVPPPWPLITLPWRVHSYFPMLGIGKWILESLKQVVPSNKNSNWVPDLGAHCLEHTMLPVPLHGQWCTIHMCICVICVFYLTLTHAVQMQ